MQIPLSLIKSFLNIDLSPAKIGEVLTLAGIEVDKIETEVPHFAGVVAAKVISAKPHPDGKTLRVAEVNDGKKTVQIVCGAPNCRAGIHVALARPGAVVKDQRIEKTSIRGVESHGMLCSASELGISEDHNGVLELPENIPLGHDLVSLLWDPVFELSLTPNLGHCMSALGIARELAAQLKLDVTIDPPGKMPRSEKLAVVQSGKLCPRYTALLIEGVQVKESSFWVKTHLQAAGQNTINNVVDATNFTMMKFGQPLHAFDADLLDGPIHVNVAEAHFKFLGLDGIEREIPKGTLLISDTKKPLAIAGIIGGMNSAVTEKTTRVLLEAAIFDSSTVRTAAKKIGLRTESAQRFEKGVDPLGLERALQEAAKLIGGKQTAFADVTAVPFAAKKLAYRPERINQLLGTKLSETEIEELFKRLDFHPKKNQITVPSYRFDITEEIDLVEEAGRVYGYNNIEKSAPKITTSKLENDPVFVFENEMRKRLVALGLSEFLNCDLIGPKLAEVAQYVTPTSMGVLKAAYSKSEEYSVLRTSLLPALLQSAKTNFDQRSSTIRAFEIGRIHFEEKGQVVEIPMGAILLAGNTMPSHWSHKGKAVDFFDLKGMIENLIHAQFRASKHLAMHPGRQADIYIGDLCVGSLGQVHPSLTEKFGLEEPIYYAEMNLLSLMQMEKKNRKMTQLSQFPASDRDWTVPLPLEKPIGEFLNAIYAVENPLLEKVELIDLYLPEHAKEKNATFRFTYRDPLKTISFEEVEAAHSKILNLLAN